MTLYSGFKYFSSTLEHTEGVIAYLETSHAWIGAAEPFTPPEKVSNLLEAFAQAATRAGKTALLLPVSSEAVAQSRNKGFKSIFIGVEPTFTLTSYPRTGRTWSSVVSTAHQLESKGAQVHEISPQCSETLKAQLNAITREWLASRKMEPLAFLNKVEPWTLSEHKRYFYIEFMGEPLAFLAAIPIWPRNGWYFIDLVRKNDSPAGTTELLTLRAMQILKAQGAEEVTLGVSPLAEIDRAHQYPFADYSSHGRIYSFLKYMFHRGSWLYNCKSLFQYKLKFEPSELRPSYLIYYKPEGRILSILDTINIFQAFSRHGLLLATFSGFWRTAVHFTVVPYIQKLLRNDIVTRSFPKNPAQFLYRCKFTIFILAVNSVVFLYSTPSITEHWTYSWNNFRSNPIHALALSPFLHTHLAHFISNFALASIFILGLECFAGSLFTAYCYIFPMILSNPATSLILWLFNLPLTGTDVGASLGIFGCIGALTWFLKGGKVISILFLCGAVFHSVLMRNPLDLNHLTALLLGFLISGWKLRFLTI